MIPVGGQPAADSNRNGESQGGGWAKWPRAAENSLVIVSLGFLVLLPMLEVLQRTFSFSLVSGTNQFVKHFTLILSMLGGAIAAREGRLLSISTASAFLKGRWKIGASIFTAGVAAAVSAFLVDASIGLIIGMRESVDTLPYGIAFWVVQLVMPICFGLIALRLIWKAADHWAGRVGALVLAGAVFWMGMKWPWEPEAMFWPGLILVLLATALGAPIFVAIGGLAVVFNWASWNETAAIAEKHYSLTTDAALPAIPLFTLAGYFLSEGGASKRIVRVFQAVMGHIRGGPAIVTALVCAYFTAFTGASGVAILALGGLLMPVLVSSHYSERNALGLLTASGSLGVLLPPCLPLILYSVVAGRVLAQVDTGLAASGGLTMQKMFLGGLLPGMLLVAMTAALGIFQGKKKPATEASFSWGETGRVIWNAKWELLLPVVALTSLFAGFATPTEAAAITAFYAFFIETVVHRDLHPTKTIPRVMTECGLLVGGVLLILGVAMGLTNYLVTEQVPTYVVEWVQAKITSPLVFLLVLNLVLLLVGCLMDIFSAIVVVVPLIIPLGIAFGIDPVHLGVLFLANLQLGYLTPPVGMNLFLASYRFDKPVMEVVRSVMPMFFVLLIGVLIITYVPALSTFLPGLFE